MTTTKKICPTCGADLIQKDKIRLLVVGLLLLAVSVVLFLKTKFWQFAIFPGLIGFYLVLWGTLGRGLWCRQSKKFPL
jgi:hypothetical protein